MIIINNCVLIGRMVKDPELRYLPNANNTAMTTFTLAVDRMLSREKKKELESRNQPTADFIRVKVWGKQAENVTNYTSRGSRVAVQGRIETSNYEAKDGTRRFITEIVAERVQFLDSYEQQELNRQNQDSYARTHAEQGYYNSVDEEINKEFDEFKQQGFYQIDNDGIPF